jgi:hypothetical protein
MDLPDAMTLEQFRGLVENGIAHIAIDDGEGGLSLDSTRPMELV